MSRGTIHDVVLTNGDDDDGDMVMSVYVGLSHNVIHHLTIFSSVHDSILFIDSHKIRVRTFWNVHVYFTVAQVVRNT